MARESFAETFNCKINFVWATSNELKIFDVGHKRRGYSIYITVSDKFNLKQNGLRYH